MQDQSTLKKIISFMLEDMGYIEYMINKKELEYHDYAKLVIEDKEDAFIIRVPSV